MMKHCYKDPFSSKVIFNYYLIVLLWLALPSSLVFGQACNRQQDSTSLVQLYNDLNGPNWPLAWNLSLPMNNWWGVTLNTDGCVQKINITNNALGQISDIQLPHLEELTLWHLAPDTLMSVIPDFSGIQHLKYLNLKMNISGGIPDFSHLPELKNLLLGGISSPGLTGEIPDFSHLLSLETLRIAKNTIDVVPDFSALPNLRSLDLSLNYLESVPDFSNLRDLDELILSANPLPDGVPDFSSLDSLLKLTLLETDLNGSFPIFTHLHNLQELKMGGVSLAGFVAEADLNGPIPNYNIPTLQSLILQYVETDSEIPDFTFLPNLQTLVITSGNLTGSIPDFTNLSKLTNLHIGGYRDAFLPKKSSITGHVPDFSNLPLLRNLDLRFNQLSGEPTNFSHLPLTTKIDLGFNALSGIVPNFSLLPSIEDIFLDQNHLSEIVTSLNTPADIDVSANWLTFEDLLPVLDKLDTYNPQDSIPVLPLFIFDQDDNLEVDLNFDAAISENHYYWYKNGSYIDETTTNKHSFPAQSWTTSDKFRVEVINPNVMDFILMTKTFQLPLVSAVQGLSAEIKLSVFPNPASKLFYVRFENSNKQKFNIHLMNPLGLFIKNAETQSDFVTLEISDLQNGVYFLSVENSGGMAMKKVLVQN